MLGRLEARFWTGPLAHLLGGGLDLLGALARAGWHRLRRGARGS
jgi:hypothetical protein